MTVAAMQRMENDAERKRFLDILDANADTPEAEMAKIGSVIDIYRKLDIAEVAHTRIQQCYDEARRILLTGTRAAIAIKIFGTDISELFMTANRLKDEISDIQGLVDLNVEQQTETPEIQIRPNRDMLARYGITMEEFNHYVELAFSGEKLAEVFEGQRSFDLVLRLDESYVNSIDKLKSALISTGTGAMVPLEDVADIVSVGGQDVALPLCLRNGLLQSCLSCSPCFPQASPADG